MYCDMVDSSGLIDRLDAEDLNDVFCQFRAFCADVIKPFGGYVYSEEGDGLIVFFGSPIAHEDDEKRAVSSALRVINAMAAFNARLYRERGISVQVRVGIDSGTIVVEDIGGGERRESAAGPPLNIGSRLVKLADPNTVLVSHSTFELVRGYFTYESLGWQTLRNIRDAVRVYQILGESGAATRLEAAGERGLTEFIGRKGELNTILGLWQIAEAGYSQIVEISGEPGIGKSRLVNAACEEISNAIVFRCSPLNSGNALFPVISRLERFLEFDQLVEPAEKLNRLEDKLRGLGLSAADAVPILASELSLPLLDRYPPCELPVQKKRQQLLDILVQWTLKEAQRQPLMAVWEDLHWADPSTIELLGLIIDRAATVPLLTLLTFRPEFQPRWTAPASLTELPLRRLEPPDV
jgi:class 3 adenylate cyclase